jgi:hypothetical protein
MTVHEAHVEHLLGCRVLDIDGDVVGRIEELHVEIVDGELVVLEYHVGPAALLERIAGFATSLPFFGAVFREPRGLRVRWQDLDLSEPSHPRVRLSRGELLRAGEA